MITTIKFIGIPGCGKSTLIDKLKETNADITVTKEELYTTHDLSELNLNPWQNATPFQEKMIETMAQKEQQTRDDELTLNVEHTPIEMIEFFSAAYKLSGFISDYGFECIRNKFRRIKKPHNCGYVYILCPPYASMRNMKIRNRDGEGAIQPFVLDTINHLIVAHYDSNLSPSKLLLHYREDDFHVKEVQEFLRQCAFERPCYCTEH